MARCADPSVKTNYTALMQPSASGQELSQTELERLESDVRVMSPVGIERVAWGWDRHERDGVGPLHASERVALEAIEEANETPAWAEWRRRLFYEVEGQGRLALQAWRAEHQRHESHVHKAEGAALAAALGLFARDKIPHADYANLVSAMAEALPWLLPERPPTPSRSR
jgi:hypothetical protein